jgi:hypothetical protein
MSNALALASVTAVLKDLLDNALVDHSVSGAVGGPVTVTALAPNRIKAGDDERTQLNLFLYHVTPNSGWRNEGLPSRNGRGDRLSNPPLALDLFYLLSAYGKQAFECEILLGYAMQMLHETPVLSRDAIRKTLTPPSPVGGGILPPALGARRAGRANQALPPADEYGRDVEDVERFPGKLPSVGGLPGFCGAYREHASIESSTPCSDARCQR